VNFWLLCTASKTVGEHSLVNLGGLCVHIVADNAFGLNLCQSFLTRILLTRLFQFSFSFFFFSFSVFISFTFTLSFYLFTVCSFQICFVKFFFSDFLLLLFHSCNPFPFLILILYLLMSHSLLYHRTVFVFITKNIFCH